MRRSRWIALAVVAVALSAGLAFLLTSQFLPDRVRATATSALATALGGDVHLGQVRLLYGPAIRIEVSDVEAWPSPTGPALRVPTTSITLDWLDLIFGRVEPGRVVLQGATLRLARSEAGAWEPAALFERLERAVAGPRAAAPGAGDVLEPLRRGAHAVRSLVLPDLDVELTDARIEILLGDAPRKRRLVLDRVSLELGVGGFRRDVALRGQASVTDGAKARGGIAIEGERDGASIALALKAQALDVGWLAGATGATAPGALRGALTGSVDASIESPPGEETRTNVELDGQLADAALTVPGAAGAPASVAKLGLVGLRATVSADPRRVSLATAGVLFAGKEFSLHGSADRPLVPDRPVELSLRAEKLTLDDVRGLVRALPASAREAALGGLAGVEGGAIDALEISADAPVASWRSLAGGDAAPLQDALTVTGYVHDVTIRISDEDRIEGVSGVAVWRGDALDLRGVRGRLRGEPLPELDLTLAGLSHLAALRSAEGTPPATAAILGRKPLFEMLTPEPGEEDLPPRWTEVVIEADQLWHPVLVHPLDDVRAVIGPTQDGVRVTIAGGRWGGVPVEVEGDWLARPSERLRLRLRAGSPAGAPAPAPFGENWVRGRFRVTLPPDAPNDPRPRLVIASAKGWFRGTGAQVRVFDGEMRLRPGGVLRGEATFDGSRSDAIPFKAPLRFEEATVSDLAVILGGSADAATGKLEAEGWFETELAPRVPLFARGRGFATARATDGELRQRMGFFVSLASLTETLNPFASRDRIRYRQVDAALALGDGRLVTEGLTVDSPDLRLVAAGGIGVTPPYEVQGVVGLFLFGKVSSLVGLVPVLSTVLLGEEKSLMGAYFEVSGPWADVKVTSVPSRSLTETGPARLVLDGVPSFVRSGIDAIESALGGSAGPSDAPPGPPPAETP